MAGEFEVRRVFHLPERSLFGLAGVVLSGRVEIGMEATVKGEEERFAARVHGVEIVESPDSPGDTEPALLFSYSREEKLSRWQEIEWSGKVVELGWGR